MKKKKKTIHFRRIRARSDNKVFRFTFNEFYLIFNFYFENKMKKMSFCTFLLSFNGICLKRVFQMFRIFGLNKYYKTFKKTSGMDLFLTILKNRYNYFSNAERRKELFIQKKKKSVYSCIL